MPPVLSIIIPFHHEEKGIVPVLQGLKEKTAVSHETLLVYDDNNDTTLSIIKDLQTSDSSIVLLANAHGPGVGGAIKTGLEKAAGKYILFFVADDEGPLTIINPMINLLEQGHDLVSGTRYKKGGGVSGGSVASRYLSRYGNLLFCFLTASGFSDATCGIKMFRKGILAKINLAPANGWGFAFELAIEAQYRGLKIAEAPYFSCNRPQGGGSHFKILPRVFVYSRILYTGVFKLWKKRVTSF